MAQEICARAQLSQDESAAALTAAGAVAIGALRGRGIRIGTHILRCAGIQDAAFTDPEAQTEELNSKVFAVLDAEKGAEMQAAIARMRVGS